MRLQLHKRHLVLLPGFDGTGNLFAPFIAAADGKFEISIAHYPKNKHLVYRQLFPCIREVLPWGEPYTLVAESFAGPLALLFAEEQPQDIQAIVLCSTFFGNPLPPPSFWEKIKKKDIFKAPFSEHLLKKNFVGQDCPPALLDAVKQSFDSVEPEVLDQRFQMALQTDTRQKLMTTRKPVLYIGAMQDGFLGDRAQKVVSLLEPKVEIVSVEGPHMLLQRKPREALAYIDAFLAEKLVQKAA
ncbi:MAG TPA: alpha/beta hydrolase [Verrucomicrobiae bacterium]|jgi:pimeloyl-ACP methyl ester carboxylesterase